MNNKPKMTKAHFQMIADLIREIPAGYLLAGHEARVRELMAGYFANALEGTNERFDWERLLAAAQGGVKHEAEKAT